MNGSISRSIWIYFVLAVPITVLVLGGWRAFDKRYRRKDERDEEDEKLEKQEARELGARIMRNIRRRTGIKVAKTWS